MVFKGYKDFTSISMTIRRDGEKGDKYFNEIQKAFYYLGICSSLLFLGVFWKQRNFCFKRALFGTKTSGDEAGDIRTGNNFHN